MNVKKAVKTLSKALRNDPDLYRGYQDNISVCMQDTLNDAGYAGNNLKNICDNGAKRFLDILIKE